MIVSYSRISFADGDKSKYDINNSRSIVNQINFINLYATKKGLFIDEEYVDDGYSGVNFDRPAFQRMIDDIEEGKIDTIITKDISRLGRNFLDTLYYITDYFPKHEIRYIAINDGYDSSNPDSGMCDMFLQVRTLLNERYIKNCSEKVRNAKQQQREKNNYMGFIAPYGYKIVKKNGIRTLEIDKYASTIITRIFKEIANGNSRIEVAKELNKEKILPPSVYMQMTTPSNRQYRKKWSAGAIYRIIRNRTYTGNIVYGRVMKKDYKSKYEYVSLDERKMIKDTHPAIIEDELYNKANLNLKRLSKKKKNNYNGLFSGLVICGKCGRPMTAMQRTRSYGKVTYHFACGKIFEGNICKSRTIADEKLKKIISTVLINIINEHIDGNKIIDTEKKNLLKKSQIDNKIEGLRINISNYEDEIKNNYLKKVNNEISIDDFVKLRESIVLKKKEAEKKLKELLSIKEEETFRDNLYEKYCDFLTEEKILKYGLRELVSEIIVSKDKLVIKFNFSLCSDATVNLY